MRCLRYIGFIVLLAPALSLPAQAINVETQNRAALQVAPAITELNVERGLATSGKIQVTNQSDKPLIVNTIVEKLELTPGTVTGTETLFNASAWVKIPVPQFAIQPGESRTVGFTVQPPGNAEPGGHYATLYFESLLPRESLAPNTALETARVGSLLFLNVAGKRTVEAGLVSPLRTAAFQQFGPINFGFAVKNSGNSHTLPSGSIKITDWQGDQVAEVVVPTNLILPQTTKDYELHWDRRWLFGRFTATLVMSYGPEHNPLISTVTFWVAPAWLILGILLGLALLAWLIYGTRGRWGRAVRVFFATTRR